MDEMGEKGFSKGGSGPRGGGGREKGGGVGAGARAAEAPTAATWAVDAWVAGAKASRAGVLVASVAARGGDGERDGGERVGQGIAAASRSLAKTAVVRRR